MNQQNSKLLIGLAVIALAFTTVILNIRALGLIDIGLIGACLAFWNRKSLPGILFYLILGGAGLTIILGILSFWFKLW